MNDQLKSEKQVGMCICFAILLNAPFLTIFNQSSTILGLPIAFVYLFVVWLIIIVALLIVSLKSNSTFKETGDDE